MTDDFAFRSKCPISSSLDIFGDKRTLLILRDMPFGAARFSEFLARPEGMMRNILTDCLRRLEVAWPIWRAMHPAHPPLYSYKLTQRGAETLPVIQALADWGARHLPPTYDSPSVFMGWTPSDHATMPKPGNA